MESVVTSRNQVLLIGAHGYVGSYLQEALTAAGADVTSNDLRCLDGREPDLVGSFTDISLADIHSFEHILFFAGTSSVPTAEADPIAACRTNVFELASFAQSLRPSQRLIYASSASVYSSGLLQRSAAPVPSVESQPLHPPMNSYDATKVACDYLMMTTVQASTLGLRMGTVSGHSRATRRELVFNAMCTSALDTGVITLRNPWAYRGLLFLSDLASVVTRLIELPEMPRILNVASVNTTMRELAETIAGTLGAEIDLLPDQPTYNFSLDLTLLQELSGGVRIPQEAILRPQIALFEATHKAQVSP